MKMCCNQFKCKIEKEEGWTIQCIIVQIIFVKNHPSWLMPIGARVCNLGIQHNSFGLCMAILVSSNFGVHHSSKENSMYLWLSPSFLE